MLKLKNKLPNNTDKKSEKSKEPERTLLLPETKLNPTKNKKKPLLPSKKRDSLKTPNVSKLPKKRNKLKSNNALNGEPDTNPTKLPEPEKSKSSLKLKKSSPPDSTPWLTILPKPPMLNDL